ncbi:MAG: type II toxin-antitoxin system Phd/YefM family antitoxin [Bdellovibrionales bacterium]|nr:type II toxin-antitoxin system Phd/YefM family antitoxin [Bdellovibrionales bacterium]
MENVNPKKLRAELKDYLGLAEKEPIRIQKRSGESYILMNEDVYAEMQNEILSLQRRLLGMSNILDEKVTEYKVGSHSKSKRTKKKA